MDFDPGSDSNEESDDGDSGQGQDGGDEDVDQSEADEDVIGAGSMEDEDSCCPVTHQYGLANLPSLCSSVESIRRGHHSDAKIQVSQQFPRRLPHDGTRSSK